MKTLILLFLTSSLFAQSITVQDWQEYKTECYNDSSKVVYTHGFDHYLHAKIDADLFNSRDFEHNYTVEKIDCKYHVIYYRWTNKPTFEGFMDWLDKKPEPIFNFNRKDEDTGLNRMCDDELQMPDWYYW